MAHQLSLRELVECSCGGGFVPTGRMSYGAEPPLGLVAPSYLMSPQLPNYTVNQFFCTCPACPTPSLSSLMHSPSPGLSTHSSNGVVHRRSQSPMRPTRRMSAAPGGLDSVVGNGAGVNSNSRRSFVDTITTSFGVTQERGSPAMMPIRFVQNTLRDGDTLFELHCSSDIMEKLKRLLRESEARGRGRSLDGYLCLSADRPISDDRP